MTEQHDSHEHDDHGVGHLVPAKYLIATCLALLVLTGLTVFAAQIDFAAFGLPDLNIIVALAIAVIKATLVCMFFMHLFWDRPFNAFVLICSFSLVTLFIGFAMTDSFEYSDEIEQYRLIELQGGDSTAVQDKLAEIEQPVGE